MKKRKRYLTLMLLPSDASKPRQLRISERTYKVGRVVVAVVALVLAFMVVDYTSMTKRALELTRVKKENVTQKIELQALSTKVNDLENTVAKLQVFDKKLRVIANIDKPAGEDYASLGMGGTASANELFVKAEDKRNKLVANMHSDLNLLKIETERRERSFAELQELLLRQSSIVASTPSIWPSRGWLTSTFGRREDPFTGRVQMHSGLDIANRLGSDVLASADGIVTKVAMIPALGKVVEVSHGYGVKSIYGHLSEFEVKLGQKVKRGQLIAKMGSTGRSTGPHLHYEIVVNGVNVNPYRYILN